jgi:hypothetical protein
MDAAAMLACARQSSQAATSALITWQQQQHSFIGSSGAATYVFDILYPAQLNKHHAACMASRHQQQLA